MYLVSVPMRCRGSLEVNDVFSDISASPLEMRFLDTTGSVHEGEGLEIGAGCSSSPGTHSHQVHFDCPLTFRNWMYLRRQSGAAHHVGTLALLLRCCRHDGGRDICALQHGGGAGGGGARLPGLAAVPDRPLHGRWAPSTQTACTDPTDEAPCRHAAVEYLMPFGPSCAAASCSKKEHSLSLRLCRCGGVAGNVLLREHGLPQGLCSCNLLRTLNLLTSLCRRGGVAGDAAAAGARAAARPGPAALRGHRPRGGDVGGPCGRREAAHHLRLPKARALLPFKAL
jgi:hypothetical protein